MPYLQLDVIGPYSAETKQLLAKRLCATYAKLMKVDMHRISVAIRELGEGGLWRMIAGEPQPAAMLMCDIRRGRSAECRLILAEALCRDCTAVLDLPPDRLNVEYTQHAGDEMYHPALGGWSPEWSDAKEG